jgi:uncharacterized RDD family membrane protein YckC
MSDQNPPSWGDQPPPPPPPGSGTGFGANEVAGLAYASWGQRVGATLVDLLVLVPPYIVVFVGLAIGASGATTDPVTGQPSGGNATGFVIATIGYLLVLGVQLWNTVFRQGRTGWSIGKQALGVRLVREQDGRPMGVGMNFVRQIVHVVDVLPCFIGFLWPIWDEKRQTFADKIMTTAVVQQKKS